MKLAKNLENLGTETAFSVLAEAKALEAKGNPMIHLGLGQPDFKTPKHTERSPRKRSVPICAGLVCTRTCSGKLITPPRPIWCLPIWSAIDMLVLWMVRRPS